MELQFLTLQEMEIMVQQHNKLYYTEMLVLFLLSVVSVPTTSTFTNDDIPSILLAVVAVVA